MSSHGSKVPLKPENRYSHEPNHMPKARGPTSQAPGQGKGRLGPSNAQPTKPVGRPGQGSTAFDLPRGDSSLNDKVGSGRLQVHLAVEDPWLPPINMRGGMGTTHHTSIFILILHLSLRALFYEI